MRPGKAGQKGNEDANFMKFCQLSSGCETRPAKGVARPAGSEPCAASGNARGDAEAREQMGRGTAASSIKWISPPSST